MVYKKYERLKVDTNVPVGIEADGHLFFESCEG